MKKSKREQYLEEIIDKDEAIINDMEQWVRISKGTTGIADILDDFGLRNIAIYGAGHMGKLLYEQLHNSKIKVSYVIDQRNVQLGNDIPVFNNDGVLPEVDAIIVTAIYYYDEIKMKLKEKNREIRVISLEDLLYWN